jgi:hypothetical protein
LADLLEFDSGSLGIPFALCARQKLGVVVGAVNGVKQVFYIVKGNRLNLL